jgi:hypothetical protein
LAISFINNGYWGNKSVHIEIDTYIIKIMVLEEGAEREDGARGRRGRRCVGYGVIRH